MRIAVIADTHDGLGVELVEAMGVADEIWHLGDVCSEETLEAIRAIGPPVWVVRGNCDALAIGPLELRIQRGGWRFHLEHIPPRTAPRGCDIFLHGHTHVPRDEMFGGVRWLNPGSVTGPRQGSLASYGWLEIEENGEMLWKVIPVR
ncbi:MAG: metallophosphoesterase family protein [Verrucomicrobia bacterium]|nr:metallophosphoesterase family protein [Verrucomicrobiota bacterium]